MHAGVGDVLELIRQPEYTGENRCLPCTVMNTLIALVLAGVAWTVMTPLAGVGVFVSCLTVISLRGYLVPGTPELTKRYLPERIHRLIGMQHEGPTPMLEEGEFDLETFLTEAAIIEDCPDEDDLCLEPNVRTAWRDEIAAIQRDGDRLERLATRLEVDAAALSVEDSPGSYIASYEDSRIGVWPSKAAFLSDLAVAPVLDEYCAGWDRLEDDQQGVVVTGLRVFLEECPVCEGEVTRTTKTIESCCSTRTQEALECADCGEQLFSQSTR